MKRSKVGDDGDDSDQSASDSPHVSKYTELDLTPAAATSEGADGSSCRHPRSSEAAATAMRCFLPPHAEALSFASRAEYEAHYNSHHTNRCLQCRKNFPSEHLLHVHIEECHDPIVRIKRDQGEHTYSCFVQGCERKCLTHQKRRMHMVDKHMYPKNFFFGVTRDGIDGRRSLLNDDGGGGGGHRRHRSAQSHRSSAASPPTTTKTAQRRDNKEKQAATATAVQDDIDIITSSMASLRFVPPAVKFGNRNLAGSSKK